MRGKIAAVAFGIAFLTILGSSTRASSSARPKVRDLLPAEGLIASSVVVIRDQAALDAHYYLADQSALALDRKTDAVLARYGTPGRESLLLVVAYPTAEDTGRAYGRFGGDFFSTDFDPVSPRVVERLETGDWAGAARRNRFLIVVLESPDRDACVGLLRRAEDLAAGATNR